MDRGRFGQGGLFAAGVALAAAAAMAVTGAARAAADHVVYAKDAGQCYSTSAPATACTPAERGDVSIATGDSVTWHIGPPTSAQPHNVAATNDVAADPGWKDFRSDFSNGDFKYTFTQPGTYEFVCEAHRETMVGTVTVTGDPVKTPTPTATATATPTATATATPTPSATPIAQPSGTGQTPPPSATTDTIKPALSKVRLKAMRRAARVTFRLSENATVTIRVKRGKTVLKSVRLQVRKGTHTVKVRSRRLKKGHRYTVELRARDAHGNTSKAARKSLRFRR
jgi:plastocyanin